VRSFETPINSGTRSINVFPTFRSPYFKITVPRIKRAIDTKVIIDCTHSLQKPNRASGTTGGDPDLVSTLMNFAMSTGADGIFVEVHPVPSQSPSDSESILQLDRLGPFLEKASRIRDAYQNI
jgi:2-dehydro-3-deoxyphosphooctonate aldolase (KDO 8-P synthase)